LIDIVRPASSPRAGTDWPNLPAAYLPEWGLIEVGTISSVEVARKHRPARNAASRLHLVVEPLLFTPCRSDSSGIMAQTPQELNPCNPYLPGDERTRKRVFTKTGTTRNAKWLIAI
jgi:hypothetical protein